MTKVAQQMASLPRRLPAQKFVSLACILVCSLHICACSWGKNVKCTRPPGRIVSKVISNTRQDTSTASAADCPANYVLKGDICYYVSKDLNVGFTLANRKCITAGAMLPEPRTEADNSIIKSIMNDNNVRSVWLGATSNGTKDSDNCSIFTWMSPPKEITYSQWKPDHPIYNPADARNCLIYDTSGNSAGWKSWHNYSRHPNNIYSICLINLTKNVSPTTTPQATTLGQTTEMPTKENVSPTTSPQATTLGQTEMPTKEATFQTSQPSQPTSIGTQPSTEPRQPTEFRTKASQPTDTTTVVTKTTTTVVTKTTTSAEDRRKKQMQTVRIMASAIGVEWLLYLSCFVAACWWWRTKGRKIEEEGQKEMERQRKRETTQKRRNQKMTCDMSTHEIKEDTPYRVIIGDTSL